MTSCWILTDGKIGMVSQCRGLAQALGLEAAMKTVDLRRPWAWLPPALVPASVGVTARHSTPLAPPWPNLLIASGRKSVAPARAVRKAARGQTFCVQIQNPGIAADAFDLVVAPAHDRAAGDRIVATLGSLHGIDDAALADARAAFAGRLAALPRPLAAVLLGGDNAVYAMTQAVVRKLADRLARLAHDAGWGLAVTASRRTPAHAIAAIRDALAGAAADIWDAGEPNPYLGFLAHADAIIVTGDSVNMVSEAAATGKPVHVVELEGGSRKFRRFHDAMAARGITRPFAGTIECWSYERPDDMARVVAEIRERMSARRAR